MNIFPSKKKKKKKASDLATSKQPSRATMLQEQHLQVALKQQHPPAFAACLQSMLMTMPPSWQAVVVTAPTAPTWQQGLSASGNQLIHNTQTGQCHSLTSHGQLQQSNVKAASAAHPVRVISWDPKPRYYVTQKKKKKKKKKTPLLIRTPSKLSLPPACQPP